MLGNFRDICGSILVVLLGELLLRTWGCGHVMFYAWPGLVP